MVAATKEKHTLFIYLVLNIKQLKKNCTEELITYLPNLTQFTIINVFTKMEQKSLRTDYPL